MGAHLKPFIQGNILLICCCVFYLAWWFIAFRPEGAIKGLKSGWLLIPAAIAGIMAVQRLVEGIGLINMENAKIPTLWIAVAGIAAYLILAVITGIALKRPVTTELVLIVGWLTLTAVELNALYNAHVFMRQGVAGLFILSLAMAILSMVCYLAYYSLDQVKGYYDGMAPLVMVALMSGGMLWFMTH